MKKPKFYIKTEIKQIDKETIVNNSSHFSKKTCQEILTMLHKQLRILDYKIIKFTLEKLVYTNEKNIEVTMVILGERYL